MYFYLIWGLIKLLQSLPLRWVARLGRFGGGIAYSLDARHRRVALRNLTRCYAQEKPPAEIKKIARENFRRIGENYCSAIKTAAMTWAQLEPHLQFADLEKIPLVENGKSCVVAIGHFGNFELYARLAHVIPGYQPATTYRGLNQPFLNDLMQSLRTRSGCMFFERRTEAGALRAAFAKAPVLLGLLADQHAGNGGVAVPFLGEVCSTTTSPAVFALRYQCSLHTGICYRTGLAQWKIVAGDAIPTHQAGKARPIESIMADVNRAFEAAVRQDPANWFWVHNRWKPFRPRHLRGAAEASSRSEPAAESALQA